MTMLSESAMMLKDISELKNEWSYERNSGRSGSYL
jgi:hypothetical protein